MRTFYNSIAALSVAALTLTACGGGSSPSTPQQSQPQGIATAPAQTGPVSSNQGSGFYYDQAFVQKAQLLGPAKFSRLGIDVVMRMHDQAGVIAFAKAVSDPKSGSYRQFLTPEQIADRFGASVTDQNTAIAYFHKYGIWVSGWKQRMMVHVAGSQSQLESAFHTKFGNYRSPEGELFIAPENAPAVSANVPLVGSANIVARTKRFTRQFVPSKGNGTGYSPQQMAAAFDFDGAYAAGYAGTGVTIGIIGTGPIVVTNAKKIGDADAYRELYNVGGSGYVTEVATTGSDPVVNGASGFAPPLPVNLIGCNASQTNPNDGYPSSDSPTPTCNPEDLEAQLDTEQSSSLAKDAAVEFYLAYNPNDGCAQSNGNPVQGSPCPAGAGIPEQGIFETDEELQTIIDHNTADVVSGSYGGPELGDVDVSPVSPPAEFTSSGTGLDPTEFAMMVSEGMAVFMSSGDAGSNTCQLGVAGHVDSLCVSYPASDPSVTGVGGTTTPLNAAGQIAGPITAWGVSTSAGSGGTGGGVSAYFPQPAWQLGAPGIIGTPLNRNVPDLALEGDPATGVAVLLYADKSFGGAELGGVGGTSVAAPEMAAMWALVVQACKQNAACASKGPAAHPGRLGSPNPLIYGMYQSAAVYGSTFLAVLYGDNSQTAYCSNPQNAAGDPIDCPTPAPGQTATPTPSIPPLDPGYSANPDGGYNQLTGLGVPFARALIRSVVGI
jgi:subtilase family serine protease